jgi:hypothetical protein
VPRGFLLPLKAHRQYEISGSPDSSWGWRIWEVGRIEYKTSYLVGTRGAGAACHPRPAAHPAVPYPTVRLDRASIGEDVLNALRHD